MPLARRLSESDEDFEARCLRLDDWQKKITRGYIAAGALFVSSMVIFIAAIVMASGSVGGVGGILLLTATTCATVTAIYQYVTTSDRK